MHKNISLVLGLLFTLMSTGILAQGTVIILDNFEDDTVGQLPGTPDVGTAVYFGTAHSIIDDYGSNSLRSVDASDTAGYAIQWIPISTPAVFEASYLYRIESSSGAGITTITSQKIFTTTATGPEPAARVVWKSDSSLEFQTTTPTVPVFTWAMGTTYRMRIKVDCTADTASLWVDDVALVTDKALGFDCIGQFDFSDASDFDFLSSRSIDDVKVVAGESIFADGFESGDTTQWSVTEPPTGVPGDTCLGAIHLPGGTFIGDLSDNTASGATDTCGIGNTIDEWISYTAICNGTITVKTCFPATAIDTIISAWNDASCVGATEIACNDDAPGALPECDLGGLNRKSLASFSAVSGTTYVFRVSAFNDGVGAYEIIGSCAP